MNTYCNEYDWIAANESYYAYYYNNFPLIPNGVILPVSFESLKLFYLSDMNGRNLEPQAAWLNCYEALFSYLLSRLDGTVTFEGRSWLQRTIENLPGAISKTYTGITNPFGIPLIVWFFGGITLILAIKK